MVGSGEGIARIGWLRRIIAFPLTQLIIGFVLIATVASLASRVSLMLDDSFNSPMHLLGSLLVAGSTVLAYKACKRWVERAPDSELPWSGALPELGTGLIFGFVLFSVTAGIVILAGGMEISGVRGWGRIWTMLSLAVVSGVVEEVLFRGLVMRHLQAMLGTWLALALTSAFFGLAHILNPNATWFSSLAIALEAGILLGAAWLLTGRLWLAIGIHAAWNFTQGWVFSVPVSGGRASLGLLITRSSGPEWLTGGDFGIEASLPAVFVATGAGLILLRMAHRRGHFAPPMWRRTGRAEVQPSSSGQ